jgi:hypothetical protein
MKKYDDYKKKKATLQEMLIKQHKLAHDLYDALDHSINKYGMRHSYYD